MLPHRSSTSASGRGDYKNMRLISPGLRYVILEPPSPEVL
jgi:hypothetical protein